MKKTIVYCGTANLYPFMYLSMKSVLEHNEIDQFYFLIMDDTFPYELPANVTLMNISDKIAHYFPAGSKAYDSDLTPMSFIRLLLGDLLPQEDIVLYLDCDTITVKNFDELWDVDLTDYLCGAVHEAETGYKVDRMILMRTIYINSGVVLFNLNNWRKYKIDQFMLFQINHHKLDNGDQTMLNMLPPEKTYVLSNIYNASLLCNAHYFQELESAKIIHFPGLPLERYWTHFLPYAKKYLPNPYVIKPEKILHTHHSRRHLYPSEGNYVNSSKTAATISSRQHVTYSELDKRELYFN